MRKNKPLILMRSISFTALIIVLLGSTFCSENKKLTPEEETYINNLLAERSAKDSSMKYEPHSPFHRDTSIDFSPLKYYEPNLDFVFHSKFFHYPVPDTVKVMGTKGEARTVIVEGYVEINYEGKNHKINVYKAFSRDGQVYYSIWFTDRTTGKETYGVGRYLDFEYKDDPDYVYEIDFNRAYNPYCAYTPMYTCPIPREEDFIDISIEAGEKNFH